MLRTAALGVIQLSARLELLDRLNNKHSMTSLRMFLIVSTGLIYTMTFIASANHGFNWPAVAFQDLMALNWRSQFDIDFAIYLLLGATWINWREGFTVKGNVYAFLSVFLGGMFTFPYLLIATYRTNGKLNSILLGVHANKNPNGG